MRKRGFAVTVIAVAALILICGIIGCASADAPGGSDDPEPAQITGITVENVVVEYDGNEHAMTVDGLLTGDTVTYSVDGQSWSNKNPTYKEPGKYEIYIRIERADHAPKTVAATLEITRTELAGIEIKGARYVYDGSVRRPQIAGIRDGDRITYRINGKEESVAAVSEIGEYEITVEIERNGEGYYKGSATIEIVPDISGTYVSREGIVKLTATTAIIDGKEKTMTYGITGAGEIDGAGKFEVDDAFFILNEKRYEKPKPDERIYSFAFGDEKVYAFGIGKVWITFGTSAELIFDGEKIASASGYNYCEGVERIDGASPEITRSYETTNIEFTAESIEEVTAYRVTLGERKEQDITDGRETVYYDGEPHGITREYTGTVKCIDGSDPPKYMEIGEYEYILVIERDGYIPKVIRYVLTINARPSGVYIGEGGLIEFDGDEAIINGERQSLDEVTVTGDTVEYDGKTYVKTDKKYALIKANGATTAVMLDEEEEVYVEHTDGETVLYNGNTWIVLMTCNEEITVSVNGKMLSPTPDGCYILGDEELAEPVVYITVYAARDNRDIIMSVEQ